MAIFGKALNYLENVFVGHTQPSLVLLERTTYWQQQERMPNLSLDPLELFRAPQGSVVSNAIFGGFIALSSASGAIINPDNGLFGFSVATGALAMTAFNIHRNRHQAHLLKSIFNEPLSHLSFSETFAHRRSELMQTPSLSWTKADTFDAIAMVTVILNKDPSLKMTLATASSPSPTPLKKAF